MIRGVLAVFAVAACGLGALSLVVQERSGSRMRLPQTARVSTVALAATHPSSAAPAARLPVPDSASGAGVSLLSFEALPADARQWRYLAPEARGSLARRVVPDRAVVQLLDAQTTTPLLCELARVDARLLVECGLAQDAVVRGGEVFACVDPAAVFLNRRDDVLEWVLACAPEAKAHLEWGGVPLDLLRRMGQQDQQEQVRDELLDLVNGASRPYTHGWGRSETLLMSALLLATQFDAGNAVRELCREVQQQPAATETVLGAARIAQLVLNDASLARTLLEQAAIMDPAAPALAEAHLLLFEDEDAAREILTHAVESAGTGSAFAGNSQLQSLAFAWWDLLGDAIEYRACMERTEAGKTDPVASLCRIAQEMKRGLRPSLELPVAFQSAESRCQSSGDWMLCARFAADLMGDTERAREYLARAERLARASQEWTLCAGLYLSRLQDGPRAQRCLKQAEHAASTTRDWARCAALAARLGEPAARVADHLAAAENMSQSSLDWLICAEQAWNILRDFPRSMECLARAERSKGFAESFLPIAESYLRLASQEERAIEMIEMAEIHAMDFRDWYGVASFYVDRLGERGKGRELLARAETLASSPNEKALCLSLKERLRR